MLNPGMFGFMKDQLLSKIDEAVRRQEELEELRSQNVVGQQAASLLLGGIAGLMMRQREQGNVLPVVLANVEVPVNEDGNYMDHVIVTTPSQNRLKITVELL